jgi:class 3 adenylate cyclase
VDVSAVQYATTVDGVRIAWRSMGEGEPVIYLAGWPFEHQELEWQSYDSRLLFEHLAQNRMLVRYDGRGCGMSDRDVADVSLTARVLDLAAVVGALGPARVALVGFSTSSPVAIVFASRHPERVSRLVLYDAHAEMRSVAASPQMMAFQALLKADWRLFTETLSNLGFGWSSGDRSRSYAAFIRECVTKDMMQRAVDEMRNIDVRHLLPSLTMPVLVLQHSDTPYDGLASARLLISSIPHAELEVIEGNYGSASGQDRQPIAEFLGAPPLEPSDLQLVTILFTDIVDSTILTQTLGDERAQELVHRHDGIVREALRVNFGMEVKHTGDGIMASFTTADRALAAAVQIQQGIAAYNATAETPLHVRVGMNSGRPVAEGEDYFGSSVQLAARVCHAAAGDEILLTGMVRQLAGEGPFTFQDKGPATLRGFQEPIPLFAVSWSP